MHDPIHTRFLDGQPGRIFPLCQESGGVIRCLPVGPQPHEKYLLRMEVPYLALDGAGTVKERGGPVMFLVRFPEDYLRSVDTGLSMKVVQALTPDIVHPNIAQGVVCLGSGFAPGTTLDWLARQLYSIASYENYTLDERVSLNPLACRLLRENPELVARLPRRPLVRRRAKLAIHVKETA